MKSEDASVIAITGSHGIMHGYLVLLPALLPLLHGDLGGIATFGLLVSLVNWFYGFGSLPVGFMADRMSKKMLITVSMALLGAASIIVGLSPNVWVAAVGFIVLGIGASLYHPCGYAHMSLLSDEMRGRYMGYQGMGGDLGMALSFLTTSLLGAQFGWRATFIIWGVVGLALAALDHLVIQDVACDLDSAREGVVPTIRKMFAVADRTTLLLTFIIVILSGMLWQGVSAYIMVYITDVKMVALVIAGGLSTLKYTVGAVAQILGGDLSDRMGRKIMLLAGFGVFTVSLLAMTLAPSNLLVLAGLVVVLGFSFFVTQSPMNALLGDVSHKDTVGVTYGVNFTLKYGIGFFTPAIAGYLAVNYSLDHVFYFFAALSAVAFLVSLFVKDKKKN
ncbi:MAG: MFS transporter [Candidatus Bathyarchaeota archaeon]